METTIVRECSKCHRQAAEYRFNKAGNLAFVRCVHCGYSAKDYAGDLKEKGEK
jgi:Zn ribbon nucleic-acid-binding protein